uniref:protein-serine/threonine phosphatase n=1 Tax=Arcella intermedia TaxID=1963864 RepID=A0A6B2LDJ2_9EUKA
MDLIKKYDISSGSCELQGVRSTMEDTHVCLDYFPPPMGQLSASYYGIYDGHGGFFTSSLLKKILHKTICERQEYKEGQILPALTAAYAETDSTILIESQNRSFQDGSTSASLLVVDGKFYAANVGDSEIMLISVSKQGHITPHLVSYPHKATDKNEQFRISSIGGKIFLNRVFGTLAVTRAFGDFKYKRPRNPEDYITSLPFITSGKLENDVLYAVLACDGLFDVLTYQEIADLTHRSFQKGNMPSAVAKELAEYAVNVLGTTDNVTVIVVKLDWIT